MSSFGGSIIGSPGNTYDANVIVVSQNGTGDYSTINEALASFSDEAANNKYVIKISPGTYNENVVLRRHITLTSFDGVGLSDTTTISSSSGATLVMPYVSSAINGLSVISTSVNATDSAIKIVDDGLPNPGVNNESFILYCHGEATNGAYVLHGDNLPPNMMVIAIWAAFDSPGGGTAVMLDGAGFGWLAGGAGGDADVVVHASNGSFFMSNLGASLSANVTGLAMLCDASMFLCIDGTIDGQDGIRLTNGSVANLQNLTSFSGITGVPVDAAVGTFLMIGNVAIESMGATPWANWSVLGTVVQLWSGITMSGTTAGPDQRPTTNLPLGFEFFATDIGNGMMLRWNGAAWVDTTGAIVP